MKDQSVFIRLNADNDRVHALMIHAKNLLDLRCKTESASHSSARVVTVTCAAAMRVALGKVVPVAPSLA